MPSVFVQLLVMKQSGSKKKVANSLVVVSSAAVLAVYAAGFTRTRAAAHQFEMQSAHRRPPVPGQPRTAPRRPPVPQPASAISEIAPAAAPEPSSNPALHKTEKPELIASLKPAPAEAPIANGAPVPPPAKASAPSTAAAPVATPPATPAASAPASPPPAAAGAAPAAPAAKPPAAPGLRDGTYSGYGTSRHGDIRAEVIVEHGRIVSANIADCMTRYSCDIIDKLPPEVAIRQSPEVDYISGATESTNAFYYAVVDALAQAQ